MYPNSAAKFSRSDGPGLGHAGEPQSERDFARGNECVEMLDLVDRQRTVLGVAPDERLLEGRVIVSVS